MAADEVTEPTNGAAAAALMAAGFGVFVLGVLSLAGDAFARVGSALNLWNPTGPLSGVTSVTLAVWLMAWFLLSRRWSRQELDLRRLNRLVTGLFIAGLLLTFPPFMDLLQGK